MIPYIKSVHFKRNTGVSFQVEGRHVQWQKWSFRVGLTQWEGLVLHQIAYKDKDKVRPIIYRARFEIYHLAHSQDQPKWRFEPHLIYSATVILIGFCIIVCFSPTLYFSIAEMVVPYGDPRDPNHRKNAFDAGEDGLGRNCHSLELGCDCIGSIYYFDAILVNVQGIPYKIKNAICLHEEDAGKWE